MKLPFLVSTFVYLSSLYPISSQQKLCQTDQGSTEVFISDVMENTEPGEVIGYVNITGTESEINLVTHPDFNSSFFIFDPASRNVTLVGELDTDEGKDYLLRLVLKCTILAVPSDSFQINVRVLVTDYNDRAPEFSRPQYQVSVPEDSLVNTIIYSETVATDKDRQYDGNSRVSYRIANTTKYSNYFKMDVPTKPDIRLARELDFETVQTMEVHIVAMDNPSPGRGPVLTSTATLTVHVTDTDDQNPVFTRTAYKGVIKEDAAKDTVVTVTPKIQAYDPDTMNATIVYRILDPYELFEINEITAEVRNVKTLYVDVPTLTVVVLAIQADNLERQWFSMLTISITEANINAPRFSSDVYNVTKTELEPVGNALVATTATDIDFGTVIQYAIVNQTPSFSINDKGVIFLNQSLDFEREQRISFNVTASDGSHTATATVIINVNDVNDNNPLIYVDDTFFNAERQQNYVITSISGSDRDVNNILTFQLRSYTGLFALRPVSVPANSLLTSAELYVTGSPEDLREDRYPLLIAVTDDGTPPRESTVFLEVAFPPLNPGTPTTTPSGPNKATLAVASLTAPEDNMLVIILGAVAGLLLVVIVILLVYICWRHRRTKEELDRAKVPRMHSAKGLTYRQAEVPDDLPKMDLGYTEEVDPISEYEGATTVQQNPLSDSGVNQGYLQSSGSQMDRDVSEIEIETAVVPYDDERYGFPQDDNEFHGDFRTFHGDDTTSNESSHSDSTGGSQHVLVKAKKAEGAKLTSWDSDDKLHPQGSQLLDAMGNTGNRKKERPEITVYF
ncbi:cadherin EGF LAG seven-pass G-type receptor 2-like isoform X2 [Mya arenaria]|uniref:cadherin EGF LAG seven-pass G-type receptor 2-like isoform X2 n=1 Tax=Mya arenaria TaxID=6604 RepID=UPI0022E40F59|nr:cadherin EGF LAG seven-pass G-type receptor 2-like isoform X2 [Mya arenaria]